MNKQQTHFEIAPVQSSFQQRVSIPDIKPPRQSSLSKFSPDMTRKGGAAHASDGNPVRPID